MTTRTTTLVATRVAVTGYSDLYVVASGLVVIVKSIYLHNWGATSSTCQLFVQRPIGDTPTVPLVFDTFARGTPASPWTGWVVMEAGDKLVVQLTSQPIDFWISGTDLPAP